jgi:hypothetical protein
VLFDYPCFSPYTSVFGYSPASGRAVEYPVQLVEEGRVGETAFWVSYVFSTPPLRPGYWNFIWVPGHGFDSRLHEEVSFDSVRQVFVKKQRIVP